MTRELTGWHVLAITVAFFGVVVAANVTLAVKAVGTFPGLEVANSYVASQSFDRDRRAQEALGWSVAPDYAPGRLVLAFTGADGRPAGVRELSVRIGRATEARDDRTPVFVADRGVWSADVTLPPGKWVVFVEAHAGDGTLFRKRLDLSVRG
ncbi:MAG: FixH family protein [Paracoccaceae bacterium]